MTRSIKLPSGHTFKIADYSSNRSRHHDYELHDANGTEYVRLTEEDLDAIVEFSDRTLQHSVPRPWHAPLPAMDDGGWPSEGTPATKPTIHHLWNALAACRDERPEFRPMPRCWPPGHLWSTDWETVTCNNCLSHAPSPAAAAPTCGRIPPTPGYGPCTRPPHKDGPCAHHFAPGTPPAKQES